MIPEKQEAERMVEKMFAKSGRKSIFLAKSLAIVCVDEIKKAIAEYADYDMSKEGQSASWKALNYWQSVKQEIEKL